ncbi:MAG: response regulator [Planctomycetaceae bacterium]|nr:response regulator [Planctomycetaceae bacterium]
MKTVLLVDDSRAVRLAMRRILAGLGCELLEAENGSLALEQLRQHPEIDAILLDWNMPIMDGITFLRAVRQDAKLPQPQIVMCTTEGEMHRIMDALQSGANEYIMKPFTQDIVLEKLQGVGIL